jgi:two-component system sensor histidine kinase KdpD
MQVAGETLGSLWATRGRDRSEPDRSETRILSAAADQLGQAVRRDRLANEATAAEVARQSDQLKSALLDSVSHDLRTPLATIRAAAESLLDPEVEWSAQEQRAVLQSIDTEAERMSRLVRNLLDLSRIEGGALHPDLEPHDLNEIVEDTASRFRSTAKQSIVIHDAPELPPVLVDDLYLDEILSNLLENAVRHADNQIVVRAAQLPDLPFIELTVEDDGPGASDAALPRLFDKFYRGEQTKGAPRLSMGVGLTVVQGLVRAMGGEATARRSDLGGLAVEVRLPIATGPEPTESQRDGGPP